MSEPVLVALLFADRVIVEKNNKKGIIGTFSRFYANDFPVVFAPWFVFAAVTNLVKGEHDFSLNLVYDKAKQVILPVSGKMKVEGASEVVEINIPVTGALFPGEGIYMLTFNIDGKQIGSRALEVLQRSQAGG